MDKRIKHIVTETQQEISTTVERDGDELEVQIRACSSLDDELRSEFHEEVRAKDSKKISVRSQVAKSNQGNETGQDVTVAFAFDHQPQALDIIQDVIEIGKDYYERQLERDLGREDEGDGTGWKRATQQKYFEDDALQEFCLLYRGILGI